MRTLAILAAAALATGAAAQQQDAPPQAPPAQTQARWPRAIELQQGTLTIYQPQVEKFEGVTLSGRCAVSWQPKDAQAAPVFGVFWFDARVLVDKDQRLMDVEQLTVKKVRFPNVTPEKEKQVAGILEAEVPKWDVHASLDEVQASIAVSQRERQSEKGISATPPKLVFSNDPAVLLLYDGEPALRKLEETGLERVVNTPLFVVRIPRPGSSSSPAGSSGTRRRIRRGRGRRTRRPRPR